MTFRQSMTDGFGGFRTGRPVHVLHAMTDELRKSHTINAAHGAQVLAPEGGAAGAAAAAREVSGSLRLLYATAALLGALVIRTVGVWAHKR